MACFGFFSPSLSALYTTISLNSTDHHGPLSFLSLPSLPPSLYALYTTISLTPVHTSHPLESFKLISLEIFTHFWVQKSILTVNLLHFTVILNFPLRDKCFLFMINKVCSHLHLQNFEFHFLLKINLLFSSWPFIYLNFNTFYFTFLFLFIVTHNFFGF